MRQNEIGQKLVSGVVGMQTVEQQVFFLLTGLKGLEHRKISDILALTYRLQNCVKLPDAPVGVVNIFPADRPGVRFVNGSQADETDIGAAGKTGGFDDKQLDVTLIAFE